VIIKQGSIVQPVAVVLDLNTDIEKEDSASANPVTNQGFNFISGFTNPSVTFTLGMLDLQSELEILLFKLLSYLAL
jgi:hypothetical protein